MTEEDEGSTSDSQDRESTRDEVAESQGQYQQGVPSVTNDTGTRGWNRSMQQSLPLPAFSSLPFPRSDPYVVQGQPNSSQRGPYDQSQVLQSFSRPAGTPHTAPQFLQHTPQSIYNNIDTINRKRSLVDEQQERGSDGPAESYTTGTGVQSITRNDKQQNGAASRPYRSDDGEGSPGSSHATGGIRSDDGRARLTSEDRINRQRELNRFHSKLSRKRKKEKEAKLLNDVMQLQIYYDLVENAPDLMSKHLSDAEATFTYANSTWTRLLGVQAESLINAKLTDLAHPKDKAFVRSQIQKALIVGFVSPFEFSMIISQQCAVIECSIRAGPERIVAVSRLRMVAPLGELNRPSSMSNPHSAQNFQNSSMLSLHNTPGPQNSSMLSLHGTQGPQNSSMLNLHGSQGPQNSSMLSLHGVPGIQNSCRGGGSNSNHSHPPLAYLIAQRTREQFEPRDTDIS